MPVTSDIATAFGGIVQTQKALAANLAAIEKPSRLRKAKATDALTESSIKVFGTGLEIEAIKDDVIEGLDAAMREATGAIHGLGVSDRFNTELETVLGKPGDAKTIATSLETLSDAFAGLSRDPEKGTKGVVEAGNAVIARFKALSEHIQGLRAKAGRQLVETVAKADVALKKLAVANNRFAVGQAAGTATPAMAEERATLLRELSAFLDFSYFGRGDGSLCILTKRGTPLADGAKPGLSTTPLKSAIEPAMTRERGDLGGVLASGVDISGEIGAGSIFALLEVRDVALPNLQSQIDTLAQTMQSRLNQIGNRVLRGDAARGGYVGSRVFADPVNQRVSLAGGETLLNVIDGEGTVLATAALSALMRRYLAKGGLPSSGVWSIAQIVRALDFWLAARTGGGGTSRARLDETGRFSFSMPEGYRVSFCDQRGVSLVSAPFDAAERSLGLSGPLVFSDASGNVWPACSALPALVRPSDSLAMIAARLNAIDGLEAKLIAEGTGARLLVSSRQGADIVAEPDEPGATVAAALDFLPAPDGAREDVAVAYTSGNAGASFTSRPFAGPDQALGIGGVLLFSDAGGKRSAGLRLDPAWGVAAMAKEIGRIKEIPGLSASLTGQGNRVALKINVPSPGRLAIEGAGGAFCSPPDTGFSATDGKLAVMLEGEELGMLDIRDGDDFAAIAERFNSQALPFARRGIGARVQSAAELSWLEIAASDGTRLSFRGTGPGGGAGGLALALNARDALGLRPMAEQIVPGFANFLGLNDLFVAAPPDAFDAKASLGVFASTATPGTARALAFSPIVAEAESPLRHAGTVAQAAELLAGAMNFAAAGGLPRSSQRLDQYAAAIVAHAHASHLAMRSQLVYERMLLDGLTAQRDGLPAIDIDSELQDLNGFRQAYHDATRVVSSMAQLFNSLAA